MIPKENLNDVIEFCYKYDIPYIGKHIDLYETIYKDKYDKFSNKHVAEVEIFNEWKDILRAYWEPELVYQLNKHKVGYERKV